MTDPPQKPSLFGHPVVTSLLAAALLAVGAYIVAESGFDVGWLVAIGAWLLVGLALVDRLRRGRGTHDKRRVRQRTLWAGLSWVVVAAALVTAAAHFSDDDEPDRSGPERPVPGLKTVEIYNKVTRGLGMAEDPKPLRLFFSPELCTSRGCVLPGIELRTGNKIDVVCQTAGQKMTNGDETTRADDKNPQLVEDDPIWYGVRTTKGRLVYFSEVWAHPRDRGGLGLTDCASVAVER
jgi:hypothetical protein